MNQKRIRVMHLIHQLGTGGAENGIINLANNINKDLFEVAICAFVGNGAQTARLDQTKSRLFEFAKKDGNDFTIPFRLSRLFRKWRPDIIHTHAWGTLCEGVIGAKLARVPIVIHGEHGTIQHNGKNIYIQRLFWNLTNKVLSVSDAHKRKLVNTIGCSSEKIKVISNGVDTEYFLVVKENDALRLSLGIAVEEVVIGTVGRLVPVKNQEMLIRSFAALKERCSNVKLILVGDGPLKDKLVQLAVDLGISSSIIFLGRRADIPNILNMMDIFVLPSICEGMSNTILEAMSCGLPVIATDVGGNPEIVKRDVTGFLVPTNNKNALADAISFLVENPGRRKEMGFAGKKLVKTEFSLKTMVRNYEKMYKEMVARLLVHSI